MKRLPKAFPESVCLPLFLLVLVILAIPLLSACGQAAQPPAPAPTPCPHYWKDTGVCQLCGVPCAHRWSGPQCTVCCLTCSHGTWQDGMCVTCGSACTHRWSEGRCSVCSSACSHTAHTSDGKCTQCLEPVYHRYFDLQCDCGKVLSFADYELPEQIAAMDSPEKGTIRSFSYTTRNYQFERDFGRDSTPITKDCRVYLPYGYDTQKKYDVLFLIHGYEQDEMAWLDEYHYCRDTIGIRAADIADSMLYYGYCPPLILVTINTNAGFWEFEYGEYSKPVQLTPEFRNDILPAIVEHFSTWAEGSTPEQLQAARDHFAIAGLSNGSLAAYYTGMMECTDLFAWFGCYSGNLGSEGILDALNSLPDGLYPIRFHFASAGSHDSQYENMLEGYSALTEGTARLADGENASLVIVGRAFHDWTTWLLSFYNTLLVFFR